MQIRESDAPPLPSLLEMNRATVVRGERNVLDAVSLRIEVGEHAAFLGPNGSGKSTLIKVITRQLYPLFRSPAAVQLFGQAHWDVQQLRSRMGIVTADLHSAFTNDEASISGREAVLSGFFGSLGLFQHVVTDEMQNAADRALTLVEAARFADRPMATLSTGEARRILIARALAPNPSALLLDEPTTGLDLTATHHFLEILRKVAAEGKSLLLVTHHVHEIVPEIERVILLRGGAIFADGPKSEVLTSERLSALYGARIQVHRAATDGYFTAEAVG